MTDKRPETTDGRATDRPVSGAPAARTAASQASDAPAIAAQASDAQASDAQAQDAPAIAAPAPATPPPDATTLHAPAAAIPAPATPAADAAAPAIPASPDSRAFPERDEELSARLQARTEELFGTGAIPVVAEDETPDVRWAPYVPVRKGIGGSALAFSIAALGGSFVVAWMFPLGILALVLGIIAVRRPEESTRLGAWAIGLSLVSLVYSGIWTWWAGFQFGWWG